MHLPCREAREPKQKKFFLLFWARHDDEVEKATGYQPAKLDLMISLLVL